MSQLPLLTLKKKKNNQNTDSPNPAPDFYRASSEAHSLLVFSCVNQLPVIPCEVARFNNWNVYTVGEVVIRTGMTREEVYTTIDSTDAAAVYLRGPVSSKIFIVYNEDIATYGRVRWNVAHEIGHIALNHFSRDISLDTCEREAEVFAAELLSPKPILAAIGPNIVSNPSTVQSLCNLSKKASQNQFDSLQNFIRFQVNSSRWADYYPVTEPFHDFIHTTFMNNLSRK